MQTIEVENALDSKGPGFIENPKKIEVFKLNPGLNHG
jgi:hypothetical protein